MHSMRSQTEQLIPTASMLRGLVISILSAYMIWLAWLSSHPRATANSGDFSSVAVMIVGTVRAIVRNFCPLGSWAA